ncbi:hypothetical protein BJ875DRAFT_488893 [Amylocarpus encephaloides]|uniref:Uncharacterized protein n=1 Tax=Amylocarpus encephaloides TaxID=45428 RepID=A0A9P7Y988_9HELO|nr:hypothetical protein BJ875DRAFT_488893 [Amylocarpus encephaloides]
MTRQQLRSTSKRLEGRYWVLTAYQWWEACELGITDAPKADAQDLDKLDQGGKLVKLLAVLQVGYLIIQLVARKVMNLASAQLEIAALAFSATCIITYILLWYRPQGVESVQIVKARKLPCQGEVNEVFCMQGPNFLWTRWRAKARQHVDSRFTPIPNDASHLFQKMQVISDITEQNESLVILTFSAVTGGVLFGGIPLLVMELSLSHGLGGNGMARVLCFDQYAAAALGLSSINVDAAEPRGPGV